MTCDEFRSLWLDRSPDDDGSGLAAHERGCSSCAAWSARAARVDDVLGAALIVAPPPELSARLRQLPASLPRVAPVSVGAPSVGKSASGFLLLVLIALGTIGLASVTSAALMGLALEPASDLLLAAPLFLDSPFIHDAQSLWMTALEACAALVLLGLLVNQALSTAWDGRERAG